MSYVTDLEINFAQADYEFTEGSDEIPVVFLRFRAAQNPFTITITPVDLYRIEEENLIGFINFKEERLDARATPGKV